jgi:uncharacterized membrane protein
MTKSKYIARLMGPVLLLVALGMVIGLLHEGESYSNLLKEFIGSRALIFISGVLALVAGVAIVNAHNLWVPDWRVIVTVLGWLLVVRGVINLVFPVWAQTLGDRMVASHSGSVAGAAIAFVLGAVLCIMGYEELWQQKPRRQGAARAAPRTRSAKRPRRRR